MNSTVNDFWGMVWDRHSHAIVMLSLLEENGKVCTIMCASVTVLCV